MRIRRETLLRFELFLSAVLLITDASIALLSLYLSTRAAIFSLAYTALFFAYALIYTIRKPDKEAYRSNRTTFVLHTLFLLMLICYFLIFAADWNFGIGLAISFVLSFEAFTLFFLLFLPLFFLLFISAYLVKKEPKTELKTKLVLFGVILCVLALYWFILLNSVFRPDDEELLKMTSVGMMLNAQNPYSNSISLMLFQHTNSVGATITTQNTLLGVMDYPALFFLLFTPFYFLAQPILHSLQAFYMPAQATIFGYAFMLVFAYVLDKRYMKRPALTLLAFSIYAITTISSITAYLMVALLMLAYVKIDTKYAWLLLGLCVSIQEQLWLPVVFLLAYSLNNHGFKRAARNALGALGVFLLINAYFILQSPTAYFRAVFFPLNQLITPFNPSPVAFMLIKFYPILLSTYTLLFGLTALLLLALFLYWNKKELIPLLSLIPFLFLDHILNSYYSFFLFPFFLSFFVSGRKDSGQGRIGKLLHEHKPLFAIVLLVLLLAILYTVYSSHARFQRNFNVSFVPQSLTIDTSSNTSTAAGLLSYRNLSNSTVYVFAIVEAGVGAGLKGLVNQSIIATPQNCSGQGYECWVNVNRLTLQGNSGEYPLTLHIPWANLSKEVRGMSLVVYNQQYFYASPSISSNGAR